MARPKSDLRRVNFNLPVTLADHYQNNAERRGQAFTRYILEALFIKAAVDSGMKLVDKDGVVHVIAFAEDIISSVQQIPHESSDQTTDLVERNSDETISFT